MSTAWATLRPKTGTMRAGRWRACWGSFAGPCLALVLVAAGCGSPDQANILLRKQNQQLHDQIGQMEKQLQGDQRTIKGLQDSRPTAPTLPAAQLANLFTTHGLAFARLTGGADLDPKKPGDDGLAVYVVPLDQTGEKIKAAGTFDVDAFDLAEQRDNHIGHWHFDLEQARQRWINVLFEYDYALICPFTKTPHHSQITVKVTFFDELTQTPFTAQEVISVQLPPAAATSPTTSPS